jgi:hypothetical protein
MPLFDTKPKLNVEECSKQFYDSTTFHAIVLGEDIWSACLDTAFNSIAEADRTFLSTDPKLFRNEMTSLRMELFAFALQCLKKFKTEQYFVSQSLFTRSYLEEEGRPDIWNIMGEYNQAIAMSATMSSNLQPTEGSIGRAQATFINEMRTRVASKWMERNLGDKAVTGGDKDRQIGCGVRVFNRLGADIKHADGVVIKLLACRLANRLACNVNLEPEALFRLGANIFGFYKGAEDYLKSVDLRE